MGTRPTVGHYQFEGWDLPTKYGWMHSGPGVQAATRMQDLVNRMAGRLIASGDQVGRLLNGAEWAGAAATAAGQAMRRGAGQIEQTAAEAATAQRCVTELGESFSAAQHRVPSPNEVPSGLGDKFLYGAAEGFSAVSPFDVQSPLHDAMEQRRELDQQANRALTDHMNTSRGRVDTIPAVAAPEPIVVAGQSAGVSAGSVGQPAGAVPTVGGAGGAPTATTAAGWTGTSPVPPAGPGPGAGAPPALPANPPSTGLTGLPGGVAGGPRTSTFPPTGTGRGVGTGTGTGPGGATLGPGAAGRTGAGERPIVGGRAGTGGRAGAGERAGAGGSATRGGAGLGTRPAVDADGASGRGAPGRDGPVGGPVTPGSRGVGSGAGAGVGSGAGGRAGTGSFLQPPLGGRGSGEEDTEHRDRYAQRADHLVGELPLVAPAVIGETPDEERRRLDRAQDGQ